MTTALGLVAGVLTTGCWLPQLVRSWRTRSTADLSWGYIGVLTVGVALWLIYGILVAQVAVIAANAATAVALLVLIGFKARFDRPARTAEPARTPTATAEPVQDPVVVASP